MYAIESEHSSSTQTLSSSICKLSSCQNNRTKTLMNVCLGGHLFALSKKFFEKLNSSTAHKLVLLSYSRLRTIKRKVCSNECFFRWYSLTLRGERCMSAIITHGLYTANVYRQTTDKLMFKTVICTVRWIRQAKCIDI